MRVGIDHVQLKEVKLTLIKKIALEGEEQYINQFKTENGKLQRIGALWCVKEAVMKCLGLGKESKVSFKDIELCHEMTGRPYVKVYGVAKETKDLLKLESLEISLSHTEESVVAICIGK